MDLLFINVESGYKNLYDICTKWDISCNELISLCDIYNIKKNDFDTIDRLLKIRENGELNKLNNILLLDNRFDLDIKEYLK